MTAEYTLSVTLQVKVDDETALRNHAFEIASAFELHLEAQYPGEGEFRATDSAVTSTGSALVTSVFAAVQALPGVASVEPLKGSIDPPD